MLNDETSVADMIWHSLGTCTYKGQSQTYISLGISQLVNFGAL